MTVAFGSRRRASARIEGAPSVERPEVAGVPIDPVDIDRALKMAFGAIAAGRFMQICTVNLDFLVNAQRDPEVRELLLTSELNIADGAPVVWLQKLRGNPQRGRVAGVDFALSLVEAAATEQASVYFLGGEDGAAREAADRIVARHPSLEVVGVDEPPRASLRDMDDDAILQRIRDARPDIILVALGHPKQDKWIHRHRDQLPAAVAMGVGCTFDLMAGKRRRAPVWMQAHGLEWLYRFLHEPRRLGIRYAVDGWWLLAALLPHSIVHRFRVSCHRSEPQGGSGN